MKKINYAKEARDLFFKKIGEKAPWIVPEGVGYCEQEWISYFMTNPYNSRSMILIENYKSPRGAISRLNPDGLWITLGYQVPEEAFNEPPREEIGYELIGEMYIDEFGNIENPNDSSPPLVRWREKEFNDKWGKTMRYNQELVDFVTACFTQDCRLFWFKK